MTRPQPDPNPSQGLECPDTLGGIQDHQVRQQSITNSPTAVKDRGQGIAEVNSPAVTAATNSRHSSGVKESVGPAGSFPSRR